MGRSRMIVQAVRTDQLGRTESSSNGLLTSCSESCKAIDDSSPGSAFVGLNEDGDSEIGVEIDESP